MKKPLLDVIFASEKRKNVLLLLGEGTQKMDTLLATLGTTRTSLLPQIRILEDHHLICHSNDSYELTTLGKMLVRKIDPLLDAVGTFGSDLDYWGTHNLDFIPRIC